MLRQFIILAVLCFYTGLSAQENAVIDTWYNEDETAQIRVFKATNGKYYGKIEWLKEDPDRLDVNNPDAVKKSEPLLGLQILKGFTYDTGKKQWTGGTIYDPDNGKTYDCYMWFEEDPNILFIKGYVLGMKFVGRETKWRKVKK
jgi:uncharacterized protein (DUF2147 family)